MGVRVHTVPNKLRVGVHASGSIQNFHVPDADAVQENARERSQVDTPRN